MQTTLQHDKLYYIYQHFQDNEKQHEIGPNNSESTNNLTLYPKINNYIEYSIFEDIIDSYSVADPGFPIGGVWTHYGGVWALFTKNVCENERIGSRRGGMHWACPLDLPMLLSR